MRPSRTDATRLPLPIMIHSHGIIHQILSGAYRHCISIGERNRQIIICHTIQAETLPLLLIDSSCQRHSVRKDLLSV